MRETLGASAQALKGREMGCFFLGGLGEVGKNNHSQLPKEKGKWGHFFFGICHEGLGRLFFFFFARIWLKRGFNK